MKRIIAVLLTICLLFTGCDNLVENHKKQVAKDIQWIQDKFESVVAEAIELWELLGVNTENKQSSGPVSRSVYNPTYRFYYNHDYKIGLNMPLDWENIDTDTMLRRFGYPDLTESQLYSMKPTDLSKLEDIPDFAMENPYDGQYIVVYYLNPACMNKPDYTNAEEFADYLLEYEQQRNAVDFFREEDCVTGQYRFFSVFSREKDKDGQVFCKRNISTQLDNGLIMVIQHSWYDIVENVPDTVRYIFCDDSYNAAYRGFSLSNRNVQRSIYDSEEENIYNPYFDFGLQLFPLKHAQDILNNRFYTATPDFIFNNFDSYCEQFDGVSAQAVIEADPESLKKLPFIPDYSLSGGYSLDNFTLNTFIHNTAADENFAYDSLDEFYKYDIDMLENLGYKNVKRYDDYVIGDKTFTYVAGYCDTGVDNSPKYASVLSLAAGDEYIYKIVIIRNFHHTIPVYDNHLISHNNNFEAAYTTMHNGVIYGR